MKEEPKKKPYPETEGVVLPYGYWEQLARLSGGDIRSQTAKSWPNVEASGGKTEQARAASNRDIPRWLYEATGVPFQVVATHGARWSPEDVRRGREESIKRGERWTPEEIALSEKMATEGPQRWGALGEVIHKPTELNPASSQAQMTIGDYIRSLDERGNKTKDVLFSMCMRGGDDKGYCDSLKSWAASSNRNIYTPVGGTSLDSRRTTGGFMLTTPSGKQVVVPTKDVAKAVKQLREKANL